MSNSYTVLSNEKTFLSFLNRLGDFSHGKLILLTPLFVLKNYQNKKEKS